MPTDFWSRFSVIPKTLGWFVGCKGDSADRPLALTGQRLLVEPWYLDAATISRDDQGAEIMTLTGWALSDPAVSFSKAASRFRVNGQAPLLVEYPLSRPDIQKVFWQRPGAAASGFRIDAPADFPDGVMEVTCSDSATLQLAKGRESWFLPDPSLHLNLPDPDRRFRVIGNSDADGFLRGGATDAFRLVRAYEAVSGKQWSAASAVLDWGVGCGRLARHLAPALGDRFFGCDLDADNVAWCASNLPGRYLPSKLEPPLPYADSSFDVIYGLSVFTHLCANWEQRWLEELSRVLRPGGVVLMTIHGQTAIDFAGLDPVDYKTLMERVETEGLVVTSTNNQLDGFVDHPEEYVNVFHSLAHVKDLWGQHFSRIEHLPGYIFTHDLVVGVK